MPRVSAILETSLYVTDLDRSCAYYQRVFDFELFVHDGRMCALGVPGGGVLLLFQHGSTNQPAPVPGGVIPPHHGAGDLHLCFAIPLGELQIWEEHLRKLELAKMFFPDLQFTQRDGEAKMQVARSVVRGDHTAGNWGRLVGAAVLEQQQYPAARDAERAHPPIMHE